MDTHKYIITAHSCDAGARTTKNRVHLVVDERRHSRSEFLIRNARYRVTRVSEPVAATSSTRSFPRVQMFVARAKRALTCDASTSLRRILTDAVRPTRCRLARSTTDRRENEILTRSRYETL